MSLRTKGCGALVLAGALIGGAVQAGAVQAQTAPEGSNPAAALRTGVTAGQEGAASVQTPGALPAGVQEQGGTIRGSVIAGTVGKPGGVPLPGVAVTATNTLSGRKYAAATAVDGSYAMKIPRNGRYVVRVELAGFAPVTQEVVLSGGDATAGAAPVKTSDFGMELASRAAKAEAQQSASGAAGGAALERGLQSLSLNAGNQDATDASAGGTAGVALPTLGNLGDSVTGEAANAGSESIAVSGQTGQTNGLANFSEDQIRQRVEDAVAQARASGQIPPGGDPTNAIVGLLGGMMAGSGPSGPGGRGGLGGGRGGGGRGGFGGGNFRNLSPTQLHGGANYSGDYSALDSAQWSPTLRPVPKESYARNSFGFTLAGSPYLPGLIKPSTKQFAFLNVSVARNTSPVVFTGAVPTPLQRGDPDPTANPNGDAIFTGLTQTVGGQATAVTLYDPQTGKPFPNNVIPRNRISPQAMYVLQHFYPEPNVPLAGTQGFNYQTTATSGTNTANASLRFIRQLGSNASGPFGSGGRGGGFGGGGGGREANRQSANAPAVLRQSLNTNFSYSHQAADQREIILPLSGRSQSDGYNAGVGYVIGYGRVTNNASATWNRSHALTSNYFTDTANDPKTAAAIGSPSTAAIGFRPDFYNGLPTLSITNFLSVANVNPQETIGQTISFSDFVAWRHGKHNMRFGGDVRRVHQDSLGGGNPLGTFSFSGYATQSPEDQAATTATCVPSATNTCSHAREATTGAGFADFLLGQPQQTQVQAGLAKIYLRENVMDWYVADDFRARANLTLNIGLRYEYFGPFSERHGRLENLTGVATETTSVNCVTPKGLNVTTAAGVLRCAKGSTASLIHGDYAMYSPRLGVAWRPTFLKQTVVRGGYGINFNTGQFATFGRLLAYQPPFAATQNNVLASAANPTGCTFANMTLSSGFDCSSKLYQNSFAVNPNYRLGYVQVYNVDVQRSMAWGVVLNVGYNGSKGSNLDVTRAPNHTATSVTTPDAVAFRYEDSIASSNFNALTVNARKRLEHGVSLQATYQYAHSIDDASSFGGGSNTSSIQNDADLRAERSNSSFDVRHRVTGSWIYELPVGPNRRFLNKGGRWAAALDGFSVSGNYTLASGTYYTPSYQSSAAQIAGGGQYTLRPDRVFNVPIAGAGMVKQFFNASAFGYPTSPSGYGTASRYSIQGPGQVLVSMAISRTVKLGDTRSFEGRATASNVFNTVQYSGIDTVLNSATFGQVTRAAGMRQVTFVGRFRF